MSIQPVGSEYQPRVEALRLGEDDRDYGWLIFAGTILVLIGVVNVIEGVAAISNSDFFLPRAHYIFGDLGFYGWVIVLNGLVQAATGLAILLKNESARWLGAMLAVINALVQMLFMPAYGFWSLTLFAVDLLVIYGLVVHGGRTFRPA